SAIWPRGRPRLWTCRSDSARAPSHSAKRGRDLADEAVEERAWILRQEHGRHEERRDAGLPQPGELVADGRDGAGEERIRRHLFGHPHAAHHRGLESYAFRSIVRDRERHDGGAG